MEIQLKIPSAHDQLYRKISRNVAGKCYLAILVKKLLNIFLQYIAFRPTSGILKANDGYQEYI